MMRGLEGISDLIRDIEARLGFDQPPEIAEVERAAPELSPAERIERVIADRVRFAFRAGPQVADASTDELLARISHDRLRAMAERYSFDRGCAVLGPSGIGKTMGAALALKRWIRANPRSRGAWIRAADLGASLARHRLGAGDPPELELARTCDVLVIDDLSWERQSEAVVEAIASRYDAGRHTLITSGLRREQLVERYGDAVLRRVCSSGGARGVTLECWPAP